MKNKAFQNIVIMSRPNAQGILDTIVALINYLQQLDTDLGLFLESNTAKVLGDQGIATLDIDAFSESVDLIMVVGGDGSMLNAAKIAMQQGLPVFGINRGQLGFLTDIYPNEFQKIDAILKGEYSEEQRFLLSASAKDHTFEDIAVNDVVIMPNEIAQMIMFELYVSDDQNETDHFICQQRADGLIVATPTGSTAYALSAGGPILHPNLEAMVVVPMYSHNLSSRPIVLESNLRITVKLSEKNKVSSAISCDGKNQQELPPGAEIKIQRHSKSFTLIHPRDHHYYTVLREKLGWEKRHHAN